MFPAKITCLLGTLNEILELLCTVCDSHGTCHQNTPLHMILFSGKDRKVRICEIKHTPWSLALSVYVYNMSAHEAALFVAVGSKGEY